MNKISLEIFDKKYLPILMGWYTNPNNSKYMLRQARTEEDTLKMIRNEEDRKCYCIKLDNLPIGYVVLMNIQSKIGRVVMMVDEPFTKKGYGFQSLSLLEEEAGKLGVEKLTLEVRTDNASAVALYEKSGFNLKYTEAIMEKNI
ncbi:MAG: GCN5-related N-acetyltransferase [Parcubacteria group bacterium GW2011_GWD2_38_11]|nr:MAG: GCN5-related N-acetyltransferase [Parcubacteria group bacterium GW2011_GWD2_38_11]